jgi:uncharacterized small protein (DUF1192 family)
MRTLPAILLLAVSSDRVRSQKPNIDSFECVKGDCQSNFGVQTHVGGFKYVGNFENGQRNGLGVETMPGGVRYAGYLKENEANGLGVMMFPDGRFYAGEWKSEYPHGCGKAVEITEPDKSGDIKMTLTHVGWFEEGDVVDPDRECYEIVNNAHEAARAAIEAAGGAPYTYVPEEPKQQRSVEEETIILDQLQQNVLTLINQISIQSQEDGSEERMEELTEALHAMEITFVKLYYSKKSAVGDQFVPVFSRDALETVIFETMLELDEAETEDPMLEEQLAAMENDLENFPSELEQTIQLLQKHVTYTSRVHMDHVNKGESKAASEAEERIAELQTRLGEVKAQMEKIQSSGDTEETMDSKEL